MLIIKNLRYGSRNYNEEFKLGRAILNSIGVRKDVMMNIYSKFPDKARGKLLKSEKIDDISKDIKISDYVDLRQFPLNEIIIELEFILEIEKEKISGYLRINNDFLKKYFGDIELDIYPFKDISNFGDLIRKYDLIKIKESVEKTLRESKIFGVYIREAYISVSEGEPSIDLSKRIWIYYSNPIFLVADLINFIKYFEELEIEEGMNVPKYLIPYYEEIIHKLKPYSVDFLSREFMTSGKFVKRFESAVSEKQVSIKKGSLILSSNNIENNFLLARDLSEKLIFPVMKQVTGDVEFKKILNDSL
jgi:hypothetical protein